MARNVRLNLKGLGEFARLPSVHAAVNAKAREVADAVRAQGLKVGDLEKGVNTKIPLPVEVYEGQTTTGMNVNRAQARVALAHPGGNGMQAKHGPLTKAAATVGMKVKAKRARSSD